LGFAGLTIDATALYALSAPDVPQSIRDAAIERAEAGEEIGRKLNKAKAKVAHGEWLPWLDREFGWSEITAQRYMRVAEAFKSVKMTDFTGLTIDATALYALSVSAVSQSVRDAAIERAEAAFATKYDTVSHFTGLTIDATALYARCRGDPLLGPV
jgi:hypothetical protein